MTNMGFIFFHCHVKPFFSRFLTSNGPIPQPNKGIVHSGHKEAFNKLLPDRTLE